MLIRIWIFKEKNTYNQLYFNISLAEACFYMMSTKTVSSSRISEKT